jgi:hypothetical protein
MSDIRVRDAEVQGSNPCIPISLGPTAMDSLTLDVKSTRLTDEQFFELCSANRDLRFERSAESSSS